MANTRDRLGSEQQSAYAHQTKGKSYLFLIGIDQYHHSPVLNNAVRDAKAFKNILVEKFQFQEEYIVELYDQEATRVNILGKLAELEHQIGKADNFILYFSGHGSMNPKKTKGFWVPVDAKDQADYIPNSRIKDHLDDIQAHHIYLIVDSCFSGSIVGRSPEYANRVEAMPSRRVLTSGRSEVVADGKPGEHSPFANCLLEYLRTQTGPIAASRLEQHVKEFTPRTAHQTPSSAYIYGLGDQGGEFVFHPKHAPVVQTQDSPPSLNAASLVRDTASAAPASTHFFQKIPLYVWFLVPLVVLPLGYWGISEWMSASDSPQEEVVQEEPKTSSVDSANIAPNQSPEDTPTTQDSPSNKQVLSGEEGLLLLESLPEESWARIQDSVGDDFRTPDMETLAGSRVRISKDLISIGAYKLFVNSLTANGYEVGDWARVPAGKSSTNDFKLPLTYVSWYGAKAYCLWLSKQGNTSYRLPESHEIKSPLQEQVEWCGNEESRERGYYPDSKNPNVDKTRKAFLARDIGFRVVRE